jgi:hypothetical protein
MIFYGFINLGFTGEITWNGMWSRREKALFQGQKIKPFIGQILLSDVWSQKSSV